MSAGGRGTIFGIPIRNLHAACAPAFIIIVKFPIARAPINALPKEVLLPRRKGVIQNMLSKTNKTPRERRKPETPTQRQQVGGGPS
jgi:hypothetical protein